MNLVRSGRLPIRSMAKAKPIGDYLKPVRSYLKDADRASLSDLQTAWAQISGPLIARRARVRNLSDGVLRVRVESAAMKAELQSFRGRELLGKMQALVPEVGLREIRFLIEDE